MARVIDLQNQKIGKLKVVQRAEDYISSQGKHQVMWHCKCDCGNEIDVRASTLRLAQKENKEISCGCKSQPKIHKCMSQQEKQEFDDLYEYVKKNILCYDSEQILPKNMVLRLRGLRNGKFIDNNSIPDLGMYSYKLILLTFKSCTLDIQKGYRSNSFKDEMHKFNYALKIVENNINDIYSRLQNTKKSEEKLETMDLSHLAHTGAEYKRKTEETSDWIPEDMW